MKELEELLLWLRVIFRLVWVGIEWVGIELCIVKWDGIGGVLLVEGVLFFFLI